MIDKRKFYIDGEWKNPKNQNDFEMLLKFIIRFNDRIKKLINCIIQ